MNGNDIITGQNRITFADSSGPACSFLDYTVTQFGQDNNTVLSSVKSINFFLDSNGGDSGQAFRIYNNTNPDSSPTENTHIFKVAEDGSVTADNYTATTSITTPLISRTGDFEIDVSGSILLDADSGTIFFQDGTAGTFGQVIRNSVNDLTIASGSTQALIFTGANAAFQGNLSVAGSSTLDGVTITDNSVKTNASNADLQLGTNGTGVIDILTATQSTVGSAGGASALPGQPTGYIKIKIGGTLRVIPFYDES